jgi:adenosine deaminase CECR1
MQYANRAFCAGFDLVGPEDRGVNLIEFVPLFLKFRLTKGSKGIPFLFHCGETRRRCKGPKYCESYPVKSTDQYKDGLSANNFHPCTAENLVDAYLLGAWRIAHGNALRSMPYLLGCYKREGIMVEVCQSTNRILGQMEKAQDHQVYTYMEYKLPVSLSTDNPIMFQ